jgi:hypothetical protein
MRTAAGLLLSPACVSGCGSRRLLNALSDLARTESVPSTGDCWQGAGHGSAESIGQRANGAASPPRLAGDAANTRASRAVGLRLVRGRF